MFFLKLGLLTCAFYAVLTALLEAGVWAIVYYNGVFLFFGQKHWFWSLGIKLALIFGFLWIISFGAARCIVYQGIKSHSPVLPN